MLYLYIKIPTPRFASNAFLLPVGCGKNKAPLLQQDGKCPFLFTCPCEQKSSNYCTSIFMAGVSTGQQEQKEGPDVPMRTDAGGYTHTEASKAKISAANKGKTPWNKGKTRSEEVKKRIAEGVRRKNREKFLEKLKGLGLTEEEYEQQKKEERRKKEAERRARRTENGGYRPTEETKQKISKIMKDKFANGEIKKREYKGPFRKGFTHSEETKEKIRQSLKKKWAEDPAYQKKMTESSGKANNEAAREKISRTLKQKWQDPAFRKKMMDSMKHRKSGTATTTEEQRAKISAAMKKKWQDDAYRKKTIKGMEKYRESLPPRKEKPVVPKVVSTIKVDGIVAVTPIQKSKKKKKKKSKVTISSATAGVKKKKKKKANKKKKKASAKSKVALANTAKKKDIAAPVEEVKPDLKDDGDISRMREERRDLYDLLYGDEGESNEEESVEEPDALPGVLDLDLLQKDDKESDSEGAKGLSSFFTGTADLDDDDLDDFDPYNLDDY